jgi:hypothetical protein
VGRARGARRLPISAGNGLAPGESCDRPRALDWSRVPVLAHLDDPPRPRTRGLVIGVVLALPVAAVFVLWVIPTLVDAVMGGARDHDVRLRAEDSYMKALCGGEAFALERDEALCGCVLGTDYPSLDCQFSFKHWTVARQGEHCSVPENHAQSLSFCSCVEAVTAKVEAAEEYQRDAEVAAYERCMVLPDAVFLPTLDELARAAQPAE